MISFKILSIHFKKSQNVFILSSRLKLHIIIFEVHLNYIIHQKINKYSNLSNKHDFRTQSNLKYLSSAFELLRIYKLS